MGALRVILADQLSETLSALDGLEPSDTVFMCEYVGGPHQVPHHPQKIAFLMASMRHFAQTLSANGHRIEYVRFEDPKNTRILSQEIEKVLQKIHPSKLIVTEPGEYALKKDMDLWAERWSIPVEIRTDTRFLCSLEEFKKRAQGKKQWRMEYFYREMRKKYSLLMDPQGEPLGGKWNYDKDNRAPLMKGAKYPKRIHHKPSSIVKEVLTLVEREFSHHFGTLTSFRYAVTRAQALQELEDFIQKGLPDFGPSQDAMTADDPYLNHSLLSAYLNVGLLLPMEVCEKAQEAYFLGRAPLNSVEGFIRQILGWREYIRGMYWLGMPQYAQLNYLNATAPLPSLYWGAPTRMACLAEVVKQTRDHAYSHHIQRLMVTGNFALLAGLDVKEVQNWYLAVYSDAHEWVEMPNTLGMALFGDGGVVASKPYAASGKYIHRMSNFCEGCAYTPQDTLGPKACPFNALYWHFLAKNREKLKNIPRLGYVYATWDAFGTVKQKAIIEKARSLLEDVKKNNI